ncbi:hypothetical protein FA15DRAFT_662855 [Coprinopsis marcescibilis]|uniref:UBC core domain-containing protein n=1 Tax=Coprinopsis marcescibilis TaxID=230819 RepID=A0A5C3LF65_COPMA|nr:hypothetical protein FA15DRAFT_662855 [Coprinopsis marcescibilis]
MSSKPNSGQRRPKLYQNDIVKVSKAASSEHFAVVLRCWHDPEDIPPQAVLADPLLRPLKQGEVGISNLSHVEGREIIDESEVILIDRGLQIGDFCKRSVDDVRSGVVTDVKVKARLAHVISGEVVEGWKTNEDLLEKQGADVGDYVIYDDWIGQIIEVFDESIVEVGQGRLVRLPELGSRLVTGDEGTDILPPAPPPNNMQSAILSFFSGSPTQSTIDKVISVKHTVYAVTWLALNQSLDQTDAAARTRPPRFWGGSETSKLILVRGKSDIEMRVGDRVYLKDTTGLPMTEHGNEADPAGIVHVQTFKVTETVTTVEVLWQDGVRETVKSVDVIPYVSPDEYDCWPGDHVLWKSEDDKRFAVVQSVNPAERTAILLFQDTVTQELVSVLELDPNGISDPSEFHGPHEGLGVRRGDFVFIHPEGSTNGAIPPSVPQIGELEPWVREMPIMDGQYTGWRKEMTDLGNSIAANRASSEIFEGAIKRPTKGDESLYWIGEVTELRLDGLVEVTHPDWVRRIYPLERLTRLYDGMDQLEDDPWLDDGGFDEYEGEELEGLWTLDEQGHWHPNSDENPGDWIDDDGYFEEQGQHYGESDAMVVDKPDVVVIPTPNLPDQEAIPSSTPVHDIEIPTNAQPEIDAPQSPSASHIPEECEQWKRFEVLASTPVDHAFYATTPAQPSKSFLARLSKEYKAFVTGLPDSILVRAYEDRTDLLRCLIIGPENTPYQDAPFVIDWMLDSNFPHSPPLAHFLSWTNGNGRVNPNLYEEGKVCLSILGTWVGDQSESWSAARSSLLQACVSIQGLVLVKEPWFCEPAFDKLRGTDEGTVNSRLYSEKAYVLSRGFIRRALELPLGDLHEEIEWLYHKKGLLGKVLQDSKTLVEKSRNSTEVSPQDADLAIPRLTSGGIITLERTLARLQKIYDQRHGEGRQGEGR